MVDLLLILSSVRSLDHFARTKNRRGPHKYLPGIRVGHTSRDFRPKIFFFFLSLFVHSLSLSLWVELSTFVVTPCQDYNAECLLRIKLGVKHHSTKEQRFVEFTIRLCADAAFFYHVNNRCIRCGRRPGTGIKIAREIVCKLIRSDQDRSTTRI